MNQPLRMAVDIGNSGARLVRLPEDDLPPFKRPLAAPLRINWQQAVNREGVGPASDSSGSCRWADNLLPLLRDDSPSQWWISSVHRPFCSSLVEFLSKQPNARTELVDHRRIPLRIDVDYPERVGIDRLLAAYAASQATDARPLLVIQAGSAVTVDLLSNDLEPPAAGGQRDSFRGGAILPGVPMMLRLLSDAADMLPKVEASELVDLPPLPGRNSQAAMLAGVSSSLVGGVQHLVGRYREALGSDVPIVLSGGDGPLLAPHLPQPIIQVDHLVLQGLRLVAASEIG